jgi:hypothetical protein
MLNNRAPKQPGEPCQAGTDLPQALTDLIPSYHHNAIKGHPVRVAKMLPVMQ